MAASVSGSMQRRKTDDQSKRIKDKLFASAARRKKTNDLLV